MTDSLHNNVSTSALAKALSIPSPQLFGTLKDYGWIKKVEDGWVLTAKGEFEGGEYVHSKRYGRYIVWPQALVEHPLLRAMESHRTLSAAALAKPYLLSAREVNRLLAELGWIKYGFQGWELTPLGEHHGGVQLEHESSGMFYVVWPVAVQEDDTLIRQLDKGSETCAIGVDRPEEAEDLFDSTEVYTSIDGHQHQSAVQLKICHWLYLSGFAHACRRRLPCTEELYADFYLPVYQLYIEYWGGAVSSTEIQQQMQRKTFYQQAGFSVINIEQDDISHLEDVLTREFRKLSIRVS